MTQQNQLPEAQRLYLKKLARRQRRVQAVRFLIFFLFFCCSGKPARLSAGSMILSSAALPGFLEPSAPCGRMEASCCIWEPRSWKPLASFGIVRRGRNRLRGSLMVPKRNFRNPGALSGHSEQPAQIRPGSSSHCMAGANIKSIIVAGISVALFGDHPEPVHRIF